MEVLAVDALAPTCLDLAYCNLVKDVLVLLGKLLDLGTGLRLHCIYVGRGAHRYACHDEAVIAKHGNRVVVVHAFGHLGQFAVGGYVVHLCGAVPCACEVEALAVGCPAVAVHVAVKDSLLFAIGLFCNILALACSDVHHAKTVEVALISVMLHAEPCYHSAVGRKLGCCVVTVVRACRVGLAKVLGVAALKVIEINVGVGTYGVVAAALLVA